jgi:hypothetical protein
MGAFERPAARLAKEKLRVGPGGTPALLPVGEFPFLGFSFRPWADT